MGPIAVSLIHYLGTVGLFSAITGFAVMLLMPERIGHGIGGNMAMLGGVAMGYALVLAAPT